MLLPYLGEASRSYVNHCTPSLPVLMLFVPRLPVFITIWPRIDIPLPFCCNNGNGSEASTPVKEEMT